MFCCCTSKVAMALSANNTTLLLSKCMLLSRLLAIIGSMTLSSKFPDCPPIVIAVSLPITCAQTIAIASGITGFTLPGIIEDPGCKASSAISPRPDSGPEFIQRKSFAIFINDTAVVFNAPDNATAVS